MIIFFGFDDGERRVETIKTEELDWGRVSNGMKQPEVCIAKKENSKRIQT